jgi:hypothetical protein
LTNFDIFATAGGAHKAVVEQFTTTADSNGVITVNFIPVTGYAQINGLEVQSGGSDVLAVNAGLLAGGTITINPPTFTNQGSLQASNGEGLAVDGGWTNAASSTISASRATLYLGNGSTAWTNSGTITVTNSTLNLGGTSSGIGSLTVTGSTLNITGGFTTAQIRSIAYSTTTVNLSGTLDNTADTLAVTAASGSWNLLGGTIKNGTYTAAGGADLVFTNQGGTLDGVTANSDLDLTQYYNAYAYVVDGLTLNATARLGNALGTTYGGLYFSATETLSGTGTVLFGKSGNNYIYETPYPSGTLTIGSGITIRGSSGYMSGYYSGDTIINQGTIRADDSGGLVGGFVYDTGFSAGYTNYTAAAIDTSGVTNPAPQAVYQTERYYYSPFSDTLANLTPNATYTVRLHFADLLYNAAGQAQFNVSINGTQVLSNFDIFATAGAAHKAVVEPFSTTADSNGVITVTFSPVTGAAQINGLEVQSGGSDVLAVNAGLLAGGTITINPATFQNQGTLAVSNGGAMNVSGMSGSLGNTQVGGANSVFSVSGSSYTVERYLWRRLHDQHQLGPGGRTDVEPLRCLDPVLGRHDYSHGGDAGTGRSTVVDFLVERLEQCRHD